MKKFKLLGSITFCLAAIFLDISEKTVEGTGTFPIERLQSFHTISGFEILKDGSTIHSEDFARPGEKIYIFIHAYEYSIPPRMYFPFYREGTMKASVTFDVSSSSHPGFRDVAELNKSVSRQGYFLMPNLSLRHELEKDLLIVLIEGIHRTAGVAEDPATLEAVADSQ